MATWVLDLDGVLWRGDQPIDGAAKALERLRRRVERVVLVTNNSNLTRAEYLTKLGHLGMPTAADDLVTSAQVAADLPTPGSSAVVCAGPGVDEALADRQVERRRHGPADTVVVGWHREFDYDRLTAAMRAVRGGARLLGTNDDATYPAPEGVLPGGGSILAAVAYASGVKADVAGKPYPPMVAFLQKKVGEVDVVVGDRPSTDGLLAARLGARFALVLSGVTTAADLPVDPAPDEVANDLTALVG
jgi:4-nitrophenyl phosphatase